jgi:bacterial/archaeal transporter family protein
MYWLTAALLSVSIGVFVALFDKYALGKGTAAAYLLLIGCVNLLTLLFLPFGFAHTPTSTQWLAGIALGIIFSIIIYASFKALEQEELSRLAPLGILSTILIAAGSALFFGERLTTNQYWAFALFLLGAIFLATRIVIKVELLHDITNFSFEKLNKKVQKAAHEFYHQGPAQHTNKLFWTMYDVFETEWISPLAPVKYKKRIKLIKGLGWMLLSIGLAVPYILLTRHHNSTLGVATGYMTVRVGLFVGSAIIASIYWKELRSFFKQKKLIAMAGIKEAVSVGSGFIWWIAATSGPLSIVQSLGSLQSAGIFICSTTLSYFGIFHESLKRRDLIQKGIGVICIAAATVLLFI